MKPKIIKIIYTILANDKPVAALEANSIEARELLKETWFLEELAALKVDGEPLYKPGTKLRVRPATEEELTQTTWNSSIWSTWIAIDAHEKPSLRVAISDGCLRSTPSRDLGGFSASDSLIRANC